MMTKMMNALAVILMVGMTLLLLSPIRAMGQSSSNHAKDENAAQILGPIMEKLARGTKVPPRLPSFIPFAGDPSAPLYSILQSSTESSYQIELSWKPECSGGNNCHFGTIRGSQNPFEEEASRERPVILKSNIKGRFVPSVCGGAGCSDSTISWSEKGFYYSVSMKAGSRTELTKMARSALKSVSQ